MYGEMVTLLVPAFLEFLQNASAQFIAELPEQQIRKQMLEILYRMPVNDTLKVHSRNILVLMFKLLEVKTTCCLGSISTNSNSKAKIQDIRLKDNCLFIAAQR